ncbi:hypothetical protein Tco_0819488 [Tanacetum coccineum]|uniref:Uncharacterized protein n=1 Tax=Tanacetum coccineum TaxID=301880 RepID=A0ABQ5AB27_9ASTR
MAANQAIEYARQCGYLTVESFVFQTNNVVRNFNYPQNVLAKPICKLLMNCPLKKAFAQYPSVLYKNFLREFWCTKIAYDPNPLADETQSCLLKEYLIKFSMMNGKKPLTLDFKTLTTSTSLDYNNGEYVGHPSPKSVKAELAKILTNPSYMDKTLINSIQKMIAYCLMIGTKVEIGEIIYSDLVTKLTNLERNIQLAGIRLPSTSLDEGIRKSQPFPEGTSTDPKDSGGNVQSADMGLSSTASDEGTESDDEEVFAARDEMDEDIPPNNEDAQSPPLNKEQHEPSHAQESDSDSSRPKLKKYDNILPLTKRKLWEKHEEAAVSYADLRASIEGCYKENVDQRDHTDKHVQETINSLDKNSTKRVDILKALNGVTKILKAIQEAVKEDLALNKKVLEATKAYITNSHNITELLSLANTFDFSGLKSLVETMKATLDAHNDQLETWAKSSISMA